MDLLSNEWGGKSRASKAQSLRHYKDSFSGNPENPGEKEKKEDKIVRLKPVPGLLAAMAANAKL